VSALITGRVGAQRARGRLAQVGTKVGEIANRLEPEALEQPNSRRVHARGIDSQVLGQVIARRLQQLSTALEPPLEQATTDALAAIVGVHGAEHVATLFAHRRAKIHHVHRADETIVAPHGERVDRKIDGHRLELFAKLVAHHVLRATVDD